MTKATLTPTHLPMDRLHAEEFNKTVEMFSSTILIQYQNKTVNAKSILGLLSLSDVKGEITLIAEGEDEVQTIEATKRLL